MVLIGTLFELIIRHSFYFTGFVRFVLRLVLYVTSPTKRIQPWRYRAPVRFFGSFIDRMYLVPQRGTHWTP